MDRAPIPYCGSAPLPSEWIARWNLDPLLLAGLIVAALLIAGCTRGPVRRSAMTALALCALLFVSPLCAMSSALFSVRVIHHLVLIAAVAPLLARLIPRGGALAGWTIAQGATLWLWHAPSLYGAALSDDTLFWLMQLSLLGSATGFWGSLRRSASPVAIVALAVTMAHMSLLGALITFADAPLYKPHLGTTDPWGLSPLEDQQLAGLIMWIPATLIYLVSMLTAAWRLLGGVRDAPLSAPSASALG